MMKKISFIAAVMFLCALGMNSCKSAEDCPAYSQTTIEQPVERA